MKAQKPRRRVPVPGKSSRAAEYKEHNRVRDAFVITLCLFFALFFVYRFWIDLNERMVKAGELPVGTITYKKKAAQRRFIDRVLWDRLQQESPVYNGDVIRTADISEASVTFSTGGQVIHLSENSLIQVFADENGPRVDFTEGSVSVESSQGGVALVSGGKTVTIGEGGIVNARTGGDGAFNLTVAAGDARLINADGSVATASAGSGLFYNQDGTVSTGPRALVFAPKPDFKMLTASNEPQSVEFLWNNTGYAAGMVTRVELASDRNFRTVTFTQEYAATERAEMRLPVGALYWRVYPVAQNGQRYLANASTGKLTMLYAPPPNLVSPLPNDTFTYRNMLPAIRYQWSGTDNALSFRLVVADNPALSSPVMTANVSGNTQVTAALGTGTWYWRVEPVFAPGITGVPAASAVSSFKILRTRGEIPAPPLMLPGPNSIISIAPGGPDSHFSWRSDVEAVSCTIMVSRNADLSAPVINARLTDSYYTYTAQDALLQTGTYYWAVSQTDADGKVSPLSEIRSLRASLFAEDARSFPAPAIVSPVEGSSIALDAAPVEFRWHPVSGADRYAFRLYRADGDSFPIYETDTSSALSVSVPVSSGSYRWTVQAIGTTRNGTMEWAGNSAEQRFSARNVAAVNLVSPANGSVVNGVDALRSGISANWTTTESLRTARFILSTNPDPLQGVPLMDIPNPRAPLVLPRLGEGTYYWTILAETQDNFRTAARSPARFQVSAAIVEPVALVSPANGEEIPLSETDARFVRWTSAETPARTRFVLSRNPNPLVGTPILDIQNPPQMIALPRLQPGNYYWTVTGTTADGFSINARSPSMFRILPVPPLPAVTYISPANGATLQPEEVRTNRGVVFTWDPVQGANEYVFTLWKDGAIRELAVNPPSSATRFVFDDLAAFSEGGNFIWQVSAQYRDSNGIVQRTGQARESRFTINISRPDRKQAYPPGITYSQ
jgi:hypothetical protein